MSTAGPSLDAGPDEPTVAFLRGILQFVGVRIAALTAGPDAGDPPAEAPHLPATGRLADLAAAVGLSDLDAALLVAAAAPDLDHRFRSLYAGLGAPGPGSLPVGLALAVVGADPWDPASRSRLGASGALRQAALVEVDPPGAPWHLQSLVVPERVVAHLLGDDTADPALTEWLAATAPVDGADVGQVANALLAGLWTVWYHDRSGAGLSAAASALAALGTPAIVVDLARVGPGESLGTVLARAQREAALRAGAVVIGPVEPQRDHRALRALATSPARPLVLVSAHGWDPAASAAVPVLVEGARVERPGRRIAWQAALTDLGVDEAVAAEAADELATLRLTPERVVTAALSAAGLAAADAEPLDQHHLRRAALLQGSTRLVQLARRIVPAATFDDLVLNPELMDELRSLPGRYETRHQVFEEWGMGRLGARGVGLTCLFAGPSGTGKTLAAEVVAHSLGVDLFIINLSQVVDKYIGETEKHLERVFTEAEGVNGVLLFDEADALFGKRSEVDSAHDRYANIEVAYLLQRMERYDGVAVLTTNLRGNVDEAFSRRLDVVCTFTEPTSEERRALWRRHLPTSLPQDPDIDVDLLGDHLPLAGGVIRNVTLTAAHVAAQAGRSVTMADLVGAAAREYRKMGRLFKVPALEAWGVEERS